MAPRTTRAGAAKSREKEDVPSPKVQESDNNPPQLFILPAKATAHARIISLVNPATEKLTRYLFCPVAGVFEFTKVAAPTTAQNSILLSRDDAKRIVEEARNIEDAESTENPSVNGNGTLHDDDRSSRQGYILQDSSIFAATSLDPLFLLMPLLSGLAAKDAEESQGLFQSAEDMFDQLSASSKHMEQLLRHKAFQDLLQDRLRCISESVDSGAGDVLYRPSSTILLQELVTKARSMTKSSTWPASMEMNLVRKPLEVPLNAIQPEHQRELSEPSDSPASQNIPILTDAETQHPSLIKQSTVSRPSEDVVELMRLRVALDFLMESYVPVKLRHCLRKVENAAKFTELIDFEPLNRHLEMVQKAKMEAQALRSLSDNISRKRSGEEDDQAAEDRAEKRRKKEDEEKKKKAESRAIKQLKKADTTGMKKLSSFFTKSSTAKS